MPLAVGHRGVRADQQPAVRRRSPGSSAGPGRAAPSTARRTACSSPSASRSCCGWPGRAVTCTLGAEGELATGRVPRLAVGRLDQSVAAAERVAGGLAGLALHLLKWPAPTSTVARPLPAAFMTWAPSVSRRLLSKVSWRTVARRTRGRRGLRGRRRRRGTAHAPANPTATVRAAAAHGRAAREGGRDRHLLLLGTARGARRRADGGSHDPPVTASGATMRLESGTITRDRGRVTQLGYG